MKGPRSFSLSVSAAVVPLRSLAHRQLCRGAARAGASWLCSSYRAPDVHPALPGHPALPTLLRHLSMLTGTAPSSSPATQPLVVTKAARPPCKPPCTPHAAFPPCRRWGSPEPPQSCGQRLLPCALGRSLPPLPSASRVPPSRGSSTRSCTGTANSRFSASGVACSVQSCTRAHLSLFFFFLVEKRPLHTTTTFGPDSMR